MDDHWRKRALDASASRGQGADPATGAPVCRSTDLGTLHSGSAGATKGFEYSRSGKTPPTAPRLGMAPSRGASGDCLPLDAATKAVLSR